MHRKALLTSFAAYSSDLIPFYARAEAADLRHEEACLAAMCELIREEARCFSRDLFAPGHCTGSALVVSPKLEHVVLTHHKKLGKWLQLGGHADDDPRLAEVALREAAEESGLAELTLLLPNALPFDLDIHRIPARGEEPEHQHFDVRYLVVASDDQLAVSAESWDVRWFSLAEAIALCPEPSMQRQFRKLALWREARPWLTGTP